MRTSALATVIYFIFTLIYKLFADPVDDMHTNLYWLYTSVIFSIISLDIRKNTILKVYSRIFLSASVYWGVMSTLHIICVFNINLYSYLREANKLTVGAVTIVILFIYLTSTLFSHDTKKQR